MIVIGRQFWCPVCKHEAGTVIALLLHMTTRHPKQPAAPPATTETPEPTKGEVTHHGVSGFVASHPADRTCLYCAPRPTDEDCLKCGGEGLRAYHADKRCRLDDGPELIR